MAARLLPLASLTLTLALSLAGVTRAAEPPAQPELEDVAVANRIKTAFLEDAPSAITKSMRVVLAEECERIRGEPIDAAWLCDSKHLRFLREVLINGMRIEEGFVCDSKDLEKILYLPPADVEHYRCVWLSFDYDTKTHDLDLDTQLRDAVD
jgi:hypothetical protein